MGTALIFVVFQFFLLGLLITFLLPAVCRLINWLTGGTKVTAQAAHDDEFNIQVKPTEETGSPYQPPVNTGSVAPSHSSAIPVPGFGKSVAAAAVSVVLVSVVQIAVMFFISFATWATVLAFAMAILIAVLGLGVVLTLILPTTIGKAMGISGLTLFSSYSLSMLVFAILGFLFYLAVGP